MERGIKRVIFRGNEYVYEETTVDYIFNGTKLNATVKRIDGAYRNPSDNYNYRLFEGKRIIKLLSLKTNVVHFLWGGNFGAGSHNKKSYFVNN